MKYSINFSKVLRSLKIEKFLDLIIYLIIYLIENSKFVVIGIYKKRNNQVVPDIYGHF